MPLHDNDLTKDTEAQIARLFAAYRQSLPDPDAGPGFMPRLWEQIEVRQASTLLWKRWAQALVTAAAALSLLMGVVLARTQSHSSPFYTSTYLELLASSEHDRDSSADVELVTVERTTYENSR